MRTIEEISWGEKVFVSFKYSTCTTGLPPWSTTLKGHDTISFFTVGSSNLLPINRLESVSPLVVVKVLACALIGDVLDVEYGVRRVHGGLILSRLADQPLFVRK